MCQNFSLTTPTAIQRRHIAFGVILIFFSIALIIAEAKRPSYSYVGYWVGAVGILPSVFAIACGIKTDKNILITSCVSDIVASATCVAGAILSLVFFSVQVYAVGWLSVILTTFLLYHAFAIFGELNVCCKMVIFEMSDAESEDNARHRRDRDLPAPPIGFIMPDEVPKPPNYDQLSIRGEPPAYSDVCFQRPLATPTSPPPATGATDQRRRQRSSSAARIPASAGNRQRHRSHQRSHSRSNIRSHRRSASLETLERA
ncbi:unnamed protein product [Hymenolepis diminuta]|uniref:Uncharacterized protein n=1 Tax=Hymenolepis diminuta TaxID=6216 RepID=A0A0R3STC7_HYMDI|nr:unnamed protein product [Hymenolepis diminuta]VUZ38530.1 unnamed protein product [Hymenolepis diminuta]